MGHFYNDNNDVRGVSSPRADIAQNKHGGKRYWTVGDVQGKNDHFNITVFN